MAGSSVMRFLISDAFDRLLLDFSQCFVCMIGLKSLEELTEKHLPYSPKSYVFDHCMLWSVGSRGSLPSQTQWRRFLSSRRLPLALGPIYVAPMALPNPRCVGLHRA